MVHVNGTKHCLPGWAVGEWQPDIDPSVKSYISKLTFPLFPLSISRCLSQMERWEDEGEKEMCLLSIAENEYRWFSEASNRKMFDFKWHFDMWILVLFIYIFFFWLLED